MSDTNTPEYHSQYQQDLITNQLLFRHKRNGFFVDVGAYDGITGSNTYFFENILDWNGVCVEPIPTIFNKLKDARKSINLQACAWTENTKKKFTCISGYAEMLSGLSDQYHPDHVNRINTEAQQHNDKIEFIDMDCIDINDILSLSAGKTIDLLSIDTEGSEFQILSHIDYNKHDISVIVMENNYNDDDVRQMLVSNGYEFLFRQQIDDVFIKSDGRFADVLSEQI